MHVFESWTLTAELQRRIQAMEIRCYCKILRISYKDHVTKEEVFAKIQQAIGPLEDLLTIVKRRKLRPGVHQVSGGGGGEGQKKWRKLVVKSSVVPQRPLRLRNRWK